MFRVKICGITRPEDAQAAVRAGADAVGLNFFSASPRCVDEPTAVRIAQSLPPGVRRVGVFVRPGADEVADRVRRVGLDLVQIHGEPAAETLRGLRATELLLAWRLTPEGLDPLVDYLDRARRLGVSPGGVLIDADVPDQYGGTGQTADWSRLCGWQQRLDVPLVLAGGLNPDNVAAAIAAVRPCGVDVASGVESRPGIKDASRVRAFVAAAGQALAQEDK